MTIHKKIDELSQEQRQQLDEIEAQLRETQTRLSEIQAQRDLYRGKLKTLAQRRVYKLMRWLGRWQWLELDQDDQPSTTILYSEPSQNSPSPHQETPPDFFQAIREPKQRGGIHYKADTIDQIITGLQLLGYEVKPYHIDVADYTAYFEQAAYPERYPNYYSFNLIEKSLEHYLAAKLLKLNPNDIYIDIASEGSPVPEIYHRLYSCTTYRQDLSYPRGINGNRIGGDAANMDVVSDDFASKMALHCSFEQFEGDTDINFIKEAGRVLKPGGAVCIVPLYLFKEYAIQTNPSIAVSQNVQFENDATIYCHPTMKNRFARFYDPAHLYERVHRQLNEMTMTIYKITNAKDVDPSCYVQFAAIIHKP